MYVGTYRSLVCIVQHWTPNTGNGQRAGGDVHSSDTIYSVKVCVHTSVDRNKIACCLLAMECMVHTVAVADRRLIYYC